ncbi:MAG TPA: hypothetical protein VGM13_03335 [Thermoanaerobaculia bacterium]|jgi:hypothetical protein
MSLLAYIGASIAAFQTWVFVRLVLLALPTLALTPLVLARLRKRGARPWLEVLSGPAFAVFIAMASVPAVPASLYGEYHPRPVFGKLTAEEARGVVLWTALAALTYGVAQVARTPKSARGIFAAGLGFTAWSAFLWVLDRSFAPVDRTLDLDELHWKLPVCFGVMASGAAFGAIRRACGARSGPFPSVAFAAALFLFFRPAEFPERWPVGRIDRIFAARLDAHGRLFLVARMRTGLPPRHPWAEDMGSDVLLQATPALAEVEGLRAVVRRPAGGYGQARLLTTPDVERAGLLFATTWRDQSLGQVVRAETVDLARSTRSYWWSLSAFGWAKLVSFGGAAWSAARVLGPGKSFLERTPDGGVLVGRTMAGREVRVPIGVARGRVLPIRAGSRAFAGYAESCSAGRAAPAPCAFFVDAETGELRTIGITFLGPPSGGMPVTLDVSPDGRAITLFREEMPSPLGPTIGTYLATISGSASRIGGCPLAERRCAVTWFRDGSAGIEDRARIDQAVLGAAEQQSFLPNFLRLPAEMRFREVGGVVLPELEENGYGRPFPFFEFVSDLSSARLVEPVVNDVQFLYDSVVFVTGGMWFREKGMSQQVVRYWPAGARRQVLLQTVGGVSEHR